MYSRDLPGLVQSYVNALPFLRPQLITNLFFVPVVFLIATRLWKLKKTEKMRGIIQLADSK
jgi:hypothetical protein